MTTDPQVEKFRVAAENGNPAAQFNMGLWHLRQPGAGPFPKPATDWFRRSAEAGVAPAQTMLGRMYLGYPGGERDADAARRWFQLAAEQGFTEAHYQMAELSVASGATEEHYQDARRWLEMAASGNHPLALCQLAYLLDEGIGGRADRLRSIKLYQQAASAGVPRSWNQLGQYFFDGHGFEADQTMALSCYLRAAKANYPGAAKAAADITARLSETELGAANSLTDEQLTAVDANAALITERAECTPEVLSQDPRIAVLHNLFTVSECQHLIAISQPHLRPSMVVSEEGKNVPDEIRTSWEMFFDPEFKDMLVWIYERRLARLSNTRPEQGEPLLILRYEPGQQYKTHVDYFDPKLPGQKKVIDETGQRFLTMLTYLSDVEAGGGTEFPKLGIRVEPERGTTLAFHNVTPNGLPDPRTKHAGLPVEKGVKWLATRWVRDRDWTGARSS